MVYNYLREDRLKRVRKRAERGIFGTGFEYRYGVVKTKSILIKAQGRLERGSLIATS